MPGRRQPRLLRRMPVRTALIRMREPCEDREVIAVLLQLLQIRREPVIAFGLFGKKERRMNSERSTNADHAPWRSGLRCQRARRSTWHRETAARRQCRSRGGRSVGRAEYGKAWGKMGSGYCLHRRGGRGQLRHFRAEREINDPPAPGVGFEIAALPVEARVGFDDMALTPGGWRNDFL